MMKGIWYKGIGHKEGRYKVKYLYLIPYTLYLLSFFLINASFTYSQDKSNPNVELPDFIITGTDVIAVQGAQKISPEFVPTISEQFFKPVLSPEELEVRDLSSPLKNDLSILDSLTFLRGNLEFGAGIYSLPVAHLSYLFPVDGFILGGRFSGENHRAYIDNSEKYLINGGLNLQYTTDHTSNVLPGTQFNLNGNFGSASFKFYAVNNPPKRTLNQGNFSFGISNQLNRQFNFDLSINDDLSSIGEEKYNENILNLRGFSRVNFSLFNINASVEYKKQFLSIDNTPANIPNSDVDDFFMVRPTGGLNISDAVKVSGGITYSTSGGNSHTAPFAAISFKINSSISLFGEYSPHAEFLTSNDLLKTNRYYEPQNFYNLFYRKREAFIAAAKFEYDKYYQVNAGIKYFSSPEYPYFVDSVSTGKFMLSSIQANDFTIFADLFFHLGPFGIMYGDFEFVNTKVESTDFVPYHPQIKTSILYGYEFDFGLTTQVGLTYVSKSYTDLPNNESIPGYFDLGLKFLYKIVPEFFFTIELSNLLDDDIYYWRGYKEAPLDVIAGFKYMW